MAKAKKRAAGIAVLEAGDARRLRVLDLEPCLAAAGAIRAGPVFRDDPLKSKPAGVGEGLRTIAIEVLDIVDSRFRAAQEPPQRSFALEQVLLLLSVGRASPVSVAAPASTPLAFKKKSPAIIDQAGHLVLTRALV